MKTAQQWQESGVGFVHQDLIEAIQTDARADLLAECERLKGEVEAAKPMRQMLQEVYEWCCDDNLCEIDGDEVKRVIDAFDKCLGERRGK